MIDVSPEGRTVLPTISYDSITIHIASIVLHLDHLVKLKQKAFLRCIEFRSVLSPFQRSVCSNCPVEVSADDGECVAFAIAKPVELFS